MSDPRIIDRSADTWHVRVLQNLPWQVDWQTEGRPSHWFRTREAAEAAVAADPAAYPAGVDTRTEREIHHNEIERRAA